MPVLLILILLLSQSALSYVLDASVKQLRPVYTQSATGCTAGKEAEVDAIQESIQRSKCEPFTQGVGRIRIEYSDSIAYGTGTLIAPNAILSAAHTLEDCLDKGTQCWFEGESNHVDFSMRIVKTFLSPKYSKSKPIEPDDLAIGILEKPLKSLPTILRLHVKPETLKGEGEHKAFAVSYNEIGNNETGKVYSQRSYRHFAVTTLRFEKGRYQHRYEYPKELRAMCLKQSLVPNRFINDRHIFLAGIMQKGDSGGPLVARYKSGDEIIGVAASTGLVRCEEPKADDIWHPVYPHLPWIAKALKENHIDVERYQPELLQF